MGKLREHTSFLHKLVDNSYRALDNGAYNLTKFDTRSHDILNLKKCILSCPFVPIIGEIKYASPSHNMLMEGEIIPKDIAEMMINSGAIAISVLTQPYEFSGSIEHISNIRGKICAPILMKDVIVSDVQIKTARMIGADSILFIKSVFDQNFAEGDIEKFLDYANRLELKAIIEAHTDVEFIDTLRLVGSKTDNIIGINNRDLNTLDVDTSITAEILNKHSKGENVVISESGISDEQTIRELRRAGADGFLVGTSILQSLDMGSKLRRLVHAL
jgi:indole-3-glycerol phosphate synthase